MISANVNIILIWYILRVGSTFANWILMVIISISGTLFSPCPILDRFDRTPLKFSPFPHVLLLSPLFPSKLIFLLPSMTDLQIVFSPYFSFRLSPSMSCPLLFSNLYSSFTQTYSSPTNHYLFSSYFSPCSSWFLWVIFIFLFPSLFLLPVLTWL